MAEFLQILGALREQMHATLSRTDVLRALVWPISILMIVTVGLVFGKAPDWLLIVFAIMLVLGLLLYGYSYTFCLHTNPDALRSEKYSLNKLALEHGLYGDSRIGLIDPDAGGSSMGGPTGTAGPALPPPDNSRGRS